jgi:quinoprotein glucose dehydrogenase
LAKHESPSVRIAAVVALRRHNSADVATFLNDTEPKVVVEAARAIHDLPIEGALPQLAGLISQNTDDDALARRVLNANYRLGGAEQALAIAQYAARGDAPQHLRLEALAMLDSWDKPYPKDRVLGMWRPLAERSQEPAVATLKQNLPGILIGDDAIRSAAAKTAARLGVKEINPALVELFTATTNAPATRADALTALVALKDAKAEELLKTALADESPEIRAAARNAMVSLRPMDALPLLEDAALTGGQFERQAALATLATLRLPGANDVVVKALDQLLADETPDWARLDVLETASKRAERSRGVDAIREKLKEYEARKPADQPLATYHETLAGGNAERGRKLFLEKSQLSCVRCHKVGETGGDVGPVLSKIGGEKNREYLLESIITPSKAIAKGFDTAVIVNDEGQIVSGIVKAEDDKELRLMTPEGKLLTIPKETIEERSVGKSAMPEDLLKHLSKPELRDLVEFLSTLR